MSAVSTIKETGEKVKAVFFFWAAENPAACKKSCCDDLCFFLMKKTGFMMCRGHRRRGGKATLTMKITGHTGHAEGNGKITKQVFSLFREKRACTYYKKVVYSLHIPHIGALKQ